MERVLDLPEPDWYLDHVVVPSVAGRRVGPVAAWQGSWAALASRLRAARLDSPRARATALALHQGFVLTRRQALECGVDSAQLRRLVRRGEWSSCGRGTVAVVGSSAAEDGGRRRHTVIATGSALRRRGHVIGNSSAAIVHGLPVLRLPELPQLITDRPVASGRRQAADVRVVRLPPGNVDRWFGAPVLAIAPTLVDLARSDPRSGLMAADAALHERLVGPDELGSAVAAAAAQPGIRRAREVLTLASPLVESPLESITHLALHDSGFPRPELQYRIRGGDGRYYRADFCWPRLRLVLEADGRGKYRDDVLWAEKVRELALARAGYRVVRVRWADVVDDWPRTSAWLWQVVGQASRTNPPV